jgi:hypothetical protein
MKTGFWVSFAGSLPMGYLNLIALRIFETHSWSGLLGYLLGIVLVEFWVIYLTFWSAERLLKNTRLMFWIDVFAVLFLVGLAFSFLPTLPNSPNASPTLSMAASPILLGLWFNALNILQISFWAGWNLYLLEKKQISSQNLYPYIIGALIGTCVGMTGFVLLAYYLLFIPNDYVFFVLFLVLAVLAGLNLVRKFIKFAS